MNIAVLVIYNHRYDENIPRIEKLYKDRFSNIYHVVPFYTGNVPNVIPVYESSLYFEGYISQAYVSLKNKNYSHFLMVADDIIINPLINERNFLDIIGMNQYECFIPGYIPSGYCWPHFYDMITYKMDGNGAEIKKVMPTYEEAFSVINRLELGYTEIRKEQLPIKWTMRRRFKNLLKKESIKKVNKLCYPLVGSYSDICVVTADAMELFCLYCGCFSATKLFVEIAIPTALHLTGVSVKYLKDIKLNKDITMWDNDDFKWLSNYNNNLQTLLDNYPSDVFYIHPIKLSKWK